MLKIVYPQWVCKYLAEKYVLRYILRCILRKDETYASTSSSRLLFLRGTGAPWSLWGERKAV
jgi:hypothetical protein